MFEIDTSIGALCVQEMVDGEYTELYVYVRRNDGIEIGLVTVSVEDETGDTALYLYEDTSDEDWTRKITFSADEINIPCE